MFTVFEKLASESYNLRMIEGDTTCILNFRINKGGFKTEEDAIMHLREFLKKKKIGEIEAKLEEGLNWGWIANFKCPGRCHLAGDRGEFQGFCMYSKLLDEATIEAKLMARLYCLNPRRP